MKENKHDVFPLNHRVEMSNFLYFRILCLYPHVNFDFKEKGENRDEPTYHLTTEGIYN